MKRLESTIIIIIISHDSSHAVIIINIQTFSLSLWPDLLSLLFFSQERSRVRERDSTKRSLYLNDKYDNLSFASILNEEKKKSNPTTRRRSIRSETRRLLQNKSSRRHLCHYFYFYVIRDHKEIEIETKSNRVYVKRSVGSLQGFCLEMKKNEIAFTLLFSVFLKNFILSLVKDHRNIRRFPL